MRPHIHPHETGMLDRRAGDAQMHFLDPGGSQQLDERSGGIAAHDRVIHHHHPFIHHIFEDDIVFKGDPQLGAANRWVQ